MTYRVWWRHHNCPLQARTDVEAKRKMRRKFASCGFMSLVAVLDGTDPNLYAVNKTKSKGIKPP